MLMSNENRKEGLLKEHELSKKLAKSAGGAMRIKGYVGSSDSPDTVCLYLNLDFNDCVYIKKSDILDVEEAPESELEFGGTYIFVKKDSEINQVRTESIKTKASFLEGDIAKAQIKKEEKELVSQVALRNSWVDACPSALACPELIQKGERLAKYYGYLTYRPRMTIPRWITLKRSWVDACPSALACPELVRSAAGGCPVWENPIELVAQITKLVDQVKIQNAQLEKITGINRG